MLNQFVTSFGGNSFYENSPYGNFSEIIPFLIT